METFPEGRRRHTRVKDVAWAVFRALRSTMLIGVVALSLFAVRTGSFQWATLKRLAVANYTLLVMVFLGVLVWDFWFERAKRQRMSEPQGID